MLKTKGINQKTAIVQTAKDLFFSKGYDHTSIDEIIQKRNIAKGTFYYYFSTKEALLFAVISSIIEEGLIQANAVADLPDIAAPQKLVMVLTAVNQNQTQQQSMMDALHKVENARMHQEIAVKAIQKLSPIITKVIVQGIKEGVFSTPYPEECVEMFLTIAQFLLDESLFERDAKTQEKHLAALLYMMQTSLHAENQTMAPLENSLIGKEAI